tara:strand:+ start:2404 stop:2703 length:300 start_codon:yes stop_codon:yes gene_type:complete
MQLQLIFAPALESTKINQSTVARLSIRKVVAMKILRRSILTGTVRIRDINITEAQLEAWQHGELIQDVAPNLTTSEREFIINGVTDEEWSDAFGEEDEV